MKKSLLFSPLVVGGVSLLAAVCLLCVCTHTSLCMQTHSRPLTNGTPLCWGNLLHASSNVSQSRGEALPRIKPLSSGVRGAWR